MIVKRKAIALLITLFFIMMITVSVGIGLKQVNSAAQEVKNDGFILQTSVILDDVMQLLNSSKALADVNSSDDMQLVFDTVSFPVISLGDTDLKVGINLSSGRSKFNINTIVDENSSVKDAFENYLKTKMINIEYLDMVEDVIVGLRADGQYKTEIVYKMSSLFKDKNNYITSVENLDEINKYYNLTYNDNKIDIINFENLFSFTKDNNYTLDVNCATQTSLEILGLSDKDVYVIEDEETKDEEEESYCSSELCASLDESEIEDLAKYRATCTPQLYFNVEIEIANDSNSSATIKFEYDLVTKKGSNFVYEI